MSLHRAGVAWTLDVEAADFLARRYSRVHTLRFAGGVEVVGSASVSVVREPYARADAVDPEAAFTASLSACHMLWFLDHAVRAGFVVSAYEDAAEGELGRIARGKMAMTKVTLRPRITFAGEARPTPADIERLHEAAHADCFIANSVTTEVIVEPAS